MGYVVEVSREELLRRREEVLARADATAEELIRRAESYALIGEEYEFYDELININFLLAGE